MGKEVKTNAMRILDRHKVAYEILNYECDEFIDGLHTAELIRHWSCREKARHIMSLWYRLQKRWI